MLPMTAALNGRGLVLKLIWLAVFVLLFIPMFVYELVMFMLGRRRYSKRQHPYWSPDQVFASFTIEKV